jgi:dipeptidyl aminopeptidase/acylaminoacyl peptidase
VTWSAIDRLKVDVDRVAIGGMSAGGMAAVGRLCTPHRFKAAILEATTGNWTTLTSWQHLDSAARQRLVQTDPSTHLDQWRGLPVSVAHSRADQWIPFDGQRRFLEQLRSHGCTIELTAFDQTGAPFEHVGFGRYAAQVKETQRAFLVNTL